MLKPRIYLFALLFVSTLSAEYLKTPYSLRDKAVYYKRTKQLNAFSCGYNVLFNAANFEHHCGFDNSVHKYAIFKEKVVSHLKKEGYNPKKTSYNSITEFLASRILTLQPFYHLHVDRRRPHGIGFSRTRKTADIFPQVLIRDRWKDNSYEKGIKKYLNNHTSAVVHFLCYVIGRTGAHGILLTVCNNEPSRGLYFFIN